MLNYQRVCCQQVICFKSCWCWFPSCALRATPSTLRHVSRSGRFLEASHGPMLCGQVCRSRSSMCLHPWLEVGTTCQLGLQDGGEILVFEEFLNPTGWKHLSWCPKWSLRLETRWSIPGVQPTSPASIEMPFVALADPDTNHMIWVFRYVNRSLKLWWCLPRWEDHVI